MRITQASFVCVCTFSLLFPLSRADPFSAGALSWSFKGDSGSSRLAAIRKAIFHRAMLGFSNSNRIYENGEGGKNRNDSIPSSEELGELEPSGEEIPDPENELISPVEPTTETDSVPQNPSNTPSASPSAVQMSQTIPVTVAPVTTTTTTTMAASGASASPTPISENMFDDVIVCKSRSPLWNVAIRNKMGHLLIVAYPGQEKKANDFARCIREDSATMKREEYLKFAMYNCVGTSLCRLNAVGGTCSCIGTPTRCMNVDFTRALIDCKYAI